MRIVAKRTGFYKVSTSAENITHVRYIIQSKRTSIALLQYYSTFALSTRPVKDMQVFCASLCVRVILDKELLRLKIKSTLKTPQFV